MSTAVLFAGGGTAGHVFPAVAVARALTELGDYEPVFIGTEGRLEERLVPEAGFRLITIDALPLPRTLSTGLAKLPFGLRRSVGQVREVVEDLQPSAAASFGGYVSFPLSRAAWKSDLPLLLHEQNAVPGLANQLAARWADTVALTFPSSAPWFKSTRHNVVTGNPVRDEILAIDRAAAHDGARAHFGLEPDRPTVLAFGGSQGARSLNRAVAAAAPEWADLGVQVIHAAGTRLHAETVDLWRDAVGDDPDDGPTVRILDFIDDMAVAYAAADLVVCRAGATSIAELTALGLPSVLVPYPGATRDHQLANARALAAVGGATVVEDGALDAESLMASLRPWLQDPAALARAGTRAAAFGRRDASTLVAAAIHQLVEPRATAPGLVADITHPGTAELPTIDDEAFEAAFETTSAADERVGTALVAAMDANAEDARVAALEAEEAEEAEEVSAHPHDQGSGASGDDRDSAIASDQSTGGGAAGSVPSSTAGGDDDAAGPADDDAAEGDRSSIGPTAQSPTKRAPTPQSATTAAPADDDGNA